MNDPELTRALEIATTLAREAGAIVLRYFRTDLTVERKDGAEPVTRADRESEAHILAGLARAFPDHGLLSEEQEERRSWADHRRAWVIDPLDGTKDFVAGREGFSVMIGLLEDRRPVLGVVYQPALDFTFRAVRGAGAEILRPGSTAPLHTSDRRDLATIRLVASKSHRSTSIDEAKRALGITDEQNVGSVGLKIGLIARNERDLYLNPEGHCRLWDACAPEIILTEAGGRMTDIHGDPLRYDPEQLQIAHGIAASNGACHEKVIRTIAPFFPRPAAT